MLDKGTTWNESETYSDALTGRTVRRITTQGTYNVKGPYHTRTNFTDDGEFMVLATYRDGYTSLCRAHVPTGDITTISDPIQSDTLAISPGTLAPKSGWVFFWQGTALRSINIHSLEERVVIEDIGREWAGSLMSVDPEEKYVISAVGPRNPDELAGLPKEQVRNYKIVWADGKDLVSKLVQAPIEGGQPEVVFEDHGVRMCHVEHNPVDGDLFYLDRDRPPMFHAGGDKSKTSRCWALRLSTGELTALTPLAEAKFQIHAAWSWDGEFLLYHGPAKLVWGPCPWYLGAVRPNGEVYREWTFDKGTHYGHVASAPDRPAIIIDGNLAPNQLQWLYYDNETPRFEHICEHNTEINTVPNNQLSHAHPSTDRQGRWVAFNYAKDKRTFVSVVKIK
jgi:hypothetical protein